MKGSAGASRTAVAAYLGSGDAFDRAMAAFAVAYAAQTRDDWSALNTEQRSAEI